ncbi:serine/threonine-protein kinase [uncultured Victivallis sp.]|uniref:serine/threonine-protein kinase n=1 Tax=uncultured Victivallis sp. TaxID=354118 RepID=UPI0025EF2F1E|nr:serine/threonine-protein kinase [uncultured Victivallis sp.]
MRIPDYEILKKCGHGAYGDVWIARNRAGSPVALKTVEKSEQIARELAGLRCYSRIADSPHLIRIFHIGEVENTLYYTMELADNLGSDKLYIPATLGNLLKKKRRFSPAETIELGQKLLQGLETLHRAQLIHRDIKPENIIYVNGEPKLSDIGLVRSMSKSLSLGGTLGFIPPERLKSGSGSKSNTDDLYAMGKVLYCCLTGNSAEDYPSFPLSLLDDEYSRLNEVILTACNRNTNLRFKTAGEFKQALRDGLSRRKRFRNKMFRLRYPGLGALLLCIIIIGTVWLLRPLRTGIQPPVTEKPLELGEMQNRVYFTMNTDGNDPDLYTSRTGHVDPVFRQYSPYELDSPPRSREVVFQRFSGEEWQSMQSKNLWRSGNTLRFLANAEGGIRLMMPLDYAYAIRFEIDYAALEDLLVFQVAALNARGIDRSLYQWTLLKTRGKLVLKPLEYQSENGGRKIQIKPVKQPEDTRGFHRVEMLQTAKIFRLYIDGELVLFAPSFFRGGYFTILHLGGGNSNFVELRNFELLKILHDPECPPERQYQLPRPGSHTG